MRATAGEGYAGLVSGGLGGTPVSESESDEARLRGMLHDLVLLFPQNSVGGLSGINDVEASQHVYSSRVQYVAEAAIGACAIKEVVRGLRSCCERQLRGSIVTPRQWQEALQAFRKLHCCLCSDGAHDAASCIFLDK